MRSRRKRLHSQQSSHQSKSCALTPQHTLRTIHPKNEKSYGQILKENTHSSTALAPTDDSNLPVRSVLAQHSQRAPTVSRAGVLVNPGSADHVVSNPVLAVARPALLVGDGRHIHFLQDISQGTRGLQSPPASHQGGHPLIVLTGVCQADWLNI